MDLTEKAKKILKEGPICNFCLGRQFAHLGHNLENNERGKIIRSKLKNEGKISKKDFKRENIPEIEKSGLEKSEVCWLCKNLFDKINNYVNLVLLALKRYDFDTFLIGSKIPLEVSRNEEKLWEKVGIEYTEPIKSEINRLIGKRVCNKIKKDVDFKRPDINVIIDIEKERVKLIINSLFIFGRYNKLKRGISQTKFYCPICKGMGCENCDYTGKKYKESVQELIAEPILRETKGIDTKFHGMGREDTDALCFGKRPFVIEILEPEIRKINLKEIQREINKKNKNKVEVFDLRFSDKKELRNIKEKKSDKVYKVIVNLEKKVSNERLKELHGLKGIVRQKTPTRVEKRRASLIRKRKVKWVEWKKIGPKKLELIIKGESGLYIKELITGDEGKTKPSVTELLGIKADWESLDVLEVCD